VVHESGQCAYSSRQGLENAPWNTGEKLTSEEGLDVLGKEGDEDDSNHHDKLRSQRDSVPNNGDLLLREWSFGNRIAQKPIHFPVDR
jgi:hypothetical protein